MRPTKALFLFVLVFVVAVAVAADDRPTWLVVVDDMDLISLYQQGANLTSDGYVPVAMDISDDDLVHILFTSQLDMEIESWRIEVFEKPSEVNSSINSLVDQGWLPVDIMLRDEKFAVLLLRADTIALDWGIAQHTKDIDDIQRLSEAAATDGLLLFGMTDGPEVMWYLFVRPSRDLFNESVVDSMETEAFFTRTNARVQNQYIPWSLFFDGTQVYVQYVK
ncbi:MAG: hypothetical protein KOO61_03145 [Spirochaetales bacterium]|nr:hypothetical protein [Spirochaetales bacterium]